MWQVLDKTSAIRYNKQTVCKPIHTHMRGSKGFDGGSEDGEAIRRPMREIANLNINADENYALAA